MDGSTILALSAQGEQQLHAATQLSSAQLSVLVRFDGQLSLEQVRATLPDELRESLDATATDLLRRGYLERAQPDPFTLEWEAGLHNLAQADGSPQAERGLAALRRSGFYVQIARSRPAARLHADRAPEVILVEDDLALAHFTRTFLLLSGMQVRMAHDRAQAVDEIRKAPRPDLILLDVELPDVDGFHILQRVREHPVLQHVPVIMLTGKATRSDVLRGLALGADGYITKPFEPDTLLQAAGTVLGLDLQRGKAPTATDPWAQAQRDGRPARNAASTSH